jgi:hypothetical protein
MSEATDQVLRRLEERLERASGAAERLFGEAAAQATSAALRQERPVKTPPQGWAAADEGQLRRPGDLELLIAVLEALGELVPSDLRRRLAEAVREVLLAIRALIDWYLERSEGGSSEPPEVQDIPIV